MVTDLKIIMSIHGKYYVSNNKLKLAEEYTEIDEDTVRQCIKRGYKINCIEYLKYNAVKVSDIILYYLAMAPKQNSVTRPTGCAVQISKEDIILHIKGFSARKNISIRLMNEFLTYILTLNELGVSRIKRGEIYTNTSDNVNLNIEFTNENRYIAYKMRIDIDKYNPTASLAKHIMNGMVIIRIEDYWMHTGTASAVYIPIDKQKVNQAIKEVKNDIKCIIDKFTSGCK